MGVSPFGSLDLVEPGFETTRAHIDGSLRPPPPCHGTGPGHSVAQMKAAFIGSAGMQSRPGLFNYRECLISLDSIPFIS